MHILTLTPPHHMFLTPSPLKISTLSELMKHALMYSYLLHRKFVNFDPSFRRDYSVFFVCQGGRDPPMNLTFSIMKWEVQKRAGKGRSTCIE